MKSKASVKLSLNNQVLNISLMSPVVVVSSFQSTGSIFISSKNPQIPGVAHFSIEKSFSVRLALVISPLGFVHQHNQTRAGSRFFSWAKTLQFQNSLKTRVKQLGETGWIHFFTLWMSFCFGLGEKWAEKSSEKVIWRGDFVGHIPFSLFNVSADEKRTLD